MPFLSTVRLRDVGLSLFRTGDMDINYILRREQVSLYNASVAASVPARMAHEGLAAAYGELLTQSGFPHHDVTLAYVGPVTPGDGGRWEDDGGPAATPSPSPVEVDPVKAEPVWSSPARPSVVPSRETPLMPAPSVAQPTPNQVADLDRELWKIGISRVHADYFEVNGFRYSNVQDAISEAKRHPRNGRAASALTVYEDRER